MAAAMELRCWGGDWGLPSVHTESLIVLAYAKFSGATVSVCPIDWTWKTLTATVPELLCGDSAVTEPTQILNFLRKQRFNADFELSARQGADTMAYIALLEEKLRPAVLHTFWVDAENYANLTRPWFASRSPFPLNFIVPGRSANTALSRILLTKGEAPLHRITEVEGKIYSDAKECLNLLAYRLGTANYFFGNSPTSLDAFVFGFIAPLYKAGLPSSPLQSHLKQLENITRFCDNILTVFFSSDHPSPPPPVQETMDANLQKLTQLVNKESNLIEKVLLLSFYLLCMGACGRWMTISAAALSTNLTDRTPNPIWQVRRTQPPPNPCPLTLIHHYKWKDSLQIEGASLNLTQPL